MKLYFCLLILIFYCLPSYAIFLEYKPNSGMKLWGVSKFETYAPLYYNSKRMIFKKFTYPQAPLRIPKDQTYPLSIYLSPKKQNIQQEKLHQWLGQFSNQNTLSHFIVFTPVDLTEDFSQNSTLLNFVKFWEEFSNRHGADKLKFNLIATTETVEIANRVVESLPEILTSITLLDTVPNTIHLNRYRGIRTRIYSTKNSPNLAAIKSFTSQLQQTGARAELIVINNAEKELVTHSIASIKHWDWISQLSWNN